jgi:hypothetical protein
VAHCATTTATTTANQKTYENQCCTWGERPLPFRPAHGGLCSLQVIFGSSFGPESVPAPIAPRCSDCADNTQTPPGTWTQRSALRRCKSPLEQAPHQAKHKGPPPDRRPGLQALCSLWHKTQNRPCCLCHTSRRSCDCGELQPPPLNADNGSGIPPLRGASTAAAKCGRRLGHPPAARSFNRRRKMRTTAQAFPRFHKFAMAA